MNTGKYLNVIRECGRDVSFPSANTIEYSPSHLNYYTYVEQAYNYASKELLDVLMKEKQLMLRLRSIKLYFLHGCGHLFTHLLDISQDELGMYFAQL